MVETPIHLYFVFQIDVKVTNIRQRLRRNKCKYAHELFQEKPAEFTSQKVTMPDCVIISVAKVGQINFSKVNFSNSWPVLILVSNSEVQFSQV